MAKPQSRSPDSTAVRTALWRAMHVELDPPPHVFEDELGLELVAPEEGWRDRPDMHPQWTRRIRAAIVARARFIEDLLLEQADRGVTQYVILGAGLDTFAQRRPELASRLRVFEVDRPGPQEWKQQRLAELGFGIPEWLRFVPVDFEAGASWWERLVSRGFDASRPAVVASTGVSMYLTKDATVAMLRQLASLAPGSTVAMTFLLPLELLEPEDRRMFEWAQKGAAASGTPFATLYAPSEMLALAREAGFKEVRHLAGASLAQRYFAERTDGLRPSSGEDFLVAITEPRDPALDRLDVLVGAWTTEGTHPLLPGVIHGTAHFEWLAGKRFLVWRTDNPPGTVPRALAVIGGGETPGVWPMHYFDERGVLRVYQVSMNGGVWRVWRDQPGFSQRFSGVFDDDERTMTLSTELDQGDGFKPDLRMTYRRA